MGNDIEFWWQVQEGAYVWSAGPLFDDERHAQDAAPTISCGYVPTPDAGPIRRYSPLRDQTGLFRVFAETEPTKDGVLQFVNRFGMLLSAHTHNKPRERRSKGGAVLVEVLAPHGEPLSLWQREIAAMRHAVRAWQWLEGNELAKLSRHVRQQHDEAGLKAVIFDTHPDLPADVNPPLPDLRLVDTVADRQHVVDWLSRFPPGDSALPTKLWLLRLINRRVVGHLDGAFALDAGGKMSLVMLPENLLQAMWLQLGLAVAQHKNYQRCVVCKSWFEVSPGVARRSRHFCSVSCKNKAFRDRKDRARQMRADGKKLREIAEELGTTMTKVKNWIEADKKAT